MRKIALAVFVVLLVLSIVFLSVMPAHAAGPAPEPPKTSEELPTGWHRLNSYTKYKVRQTVGDQTTNEMTISALPETLADNKTVIDPTWYLLTDDSGQSYFHSGPNLYEAIAKHTRVSVTDSVGKLYIWDPAITIGDKTYGHDKSDAVIADDPINKVTKSNTLKWTYPNLTRYDRMIPGVITEYWVIARDPKSSVVINLNNSAEKGTKGSMQWIVVYDANYLPIPAKQNSYGAYIISAEDLAKAKYPVTIDPNLAMFSNAFDGYLQVYNSTYSSALNATLADYVSYSTPSIAVGQSYDGFQYFISKGTVYFDTSALGTGAVLTSGILELGGSFDSSTTNFNIVIQNGQPTYPGMPATNSDFYKGNYSGNGGQINTASWSLGPYNVINLNATGLSWINKTGYTKFLINSDRVIAGTTPTGNEDVGFWSLESGTNMPYLSLLYTANLPTVATQPVVSKTETSATVAGLLSADGGESCSVRFQYDTSTAYLFATAYDSGFVTGQSFSSTILGLQAGTRYFYRAQATNSAGTASGADGQVLTYPYAPNTFAAVKGNNQVSLSWVKGTGAANTVIQRAVGAVPPATPTSGTNVYNAGGTSTVDNTVTNGTQYSYAAWSYTTSGALAEYSTAPVTATVTPGAATAPGVTTLTPTAVVGVTATLNGTLTDLGGAATCDVWFQYYTGAGTWTDNETTHTPQTTTGNFSAGIAGLSPASLYHQRAAASNVTGTTYGADITFTTGGASAPTMTTNAATGVQLTSATLNGTVTADGGSTTTVWFDYGLTASYGSTTPTSSGLVTADTFYFGLSSLTPNTTYHFRAVGQNTTGTGYGADATFATNNATAPTVRSDSASGVGADSATLNGTLLTDGGVSCDVRFQTSPTGAYAGEETSTAWVSDKAAGAAFTYNLTGLSISTTYHFRAQAQNAGGIGSGSDETFATVFTAPTDFVAKAISSSTINLSWTKTADQTFIVYKTGSYPVDRADGTQGYFGPGNFTAVAGLQSGTSYYFSAFSWATGDLWASGSVQDVATTFPAGKELTAPTAPAGDNPVAPASWWQEPDATYLQLFPFYASVNALADAYQVPHGSAWFTIGMALVLIFGALALAFSRSGFVAATTGLFIMFIVGLLHMISTWLCFPYAVIAGGILYGLRRQ